MISEDRLRELCEAALMAYAETQPDEETRMARMIAPISEMSELLAIRNPPSGEAGEPDAWQHRLYYDDTQAWSEWRPGKFITGLYVNAFEERPLYALPTIKEPSDGK